MGGDFYAVRELEDRNGGTGNLSHMEMFSKFLDCYALREVPIARSRFTWSNMQESRRMSKLDRFFLLHEWDRASPFMKRESMPRPVSDHIPILLNGRVYNAGPKPFKFKNM